MRWPVKRRLLSALVGALVLTTSQCSWFKQDQSKVRGVTPKESANLSAAFGSPPLEPKVPLPDKQTLPQDRLEALGEMALQSRDYESSLLNFLQILKDNPTRYDLHYKVGVILFLTGQLEAARKELALVLINRPEMLEAHEALGLVHLQEKNYSLAADEFQFVLSREPKRAQARHLLGVTFLEAGQTGRAIVQLKQAAELDSRQVSTLIALGQAYLQQKDYPQALAALKKAQSLDSQNQKVNYHLGMALAGLKRYPEALEAFIKAGDEAQAYNNIGVHYFLEGRYEEAAKCFQKAIELRPTFYGEAKDNLQRALEKLQETQKNDG
jgi:tetratricopeptide (TPR) repeat protein